MAYKNIEDRRAYQRQYMRERREWLAKHHVCTECGKEDARTMIGKRLCFNCLEKRRGHPLEIDVGIEPKQKKIWQKHSVPKSEYYANGLCVKCGQRPYIKGHKTCQQCYDSSCRSAWLGHKAKGIRQIYPPTSNTPKALAAYQYCIEHRQECIERWRAEYDCEYEERASNKKQRESKEIR